MRADRQRRFAQEIREPYYLNNNRYEIERNLITLYFQGWPGLKDSNKATAENGSRKTIASVK